MSKVAAIQTTGKAATREPAGLILQRACAFGGVAGLSGEWEECKTTKLVGKPLQMKLAVSQPGDEFEQEAERAAERVVRMAEPERGPGVTESQVQPLVQRRLSGSGPKGITQRPQSS